MSEVEELREKLKKATIALRQTKEWKDRAERAEAELARERARSTRLLSELGEARMSLAQVQGASASARSEVAVPAVDELDSLLAEVSTDLNPGPGGAHRAAPPPASAKAELDAVMQMLDVRDDSTATPAAVAPTSPVTPTRPSRRDEGERVATFQLKPGASSGAASTHTYTNEKNDDAAVRYWGTAAEAEHKGLPPSFTPVRGELVRYTFVSEAQLESDLRNMHNLLRIGTLDNDTYNRQRDHMLVMRRGGPKFGANDNPDRPRFKGRGPDAEADRRLREFEPLSKSTEQALLRKQREDRERKWR